MPTDPNTVEGQYRSSPAPDPNSTSKSVALPLLACSRTFDILVVINAIATFLLLRIRITNSRLPSLIAVVQ